MQAVQQGKEAYGRRKSDVVHSPRHSWLRIRLINACAIVAAAVIALFALVTVEHVIESEADGEQHNEAYRTCSAAARDLLEASDFMTNQVRLFALTGNRENMDAYLEELEQTDRRSKALETLRTYLSDDHDAVADLEEALAYSNELAARELMSMRLTALATGITDIPREVAAVELDDATLAMTPDEQRALAQELVLGDEYSSGKEQIVSSVEKCSNGLLAHLNDQVVEGNALMRSQLSAMQAVILALLCLVVLVIFATIFLVLWPLAAYTSQIKRDERLAYSGAYELRYLAEAYNAIYDENRERTMQLRHAAERDALTGLYNRGAFDALLEEHTVDVALLLIDVDYFKSVNDTFGHDVGDAVLRKVARLIAGSFRESDYPCRVGGDEFAVIMSGIDPSMHDVLVDKIEAVAQALRDTSDGLPVVTLSIGIAFSGHHDGQDSLFKATDQALYAAKENGRNGYAFFGEEAVHAGA